MFFFLLFLVLIHQNTYSNFITYHNVTARNSAFLASVAADTGVDILWSNPANIDNVESLCISFNYGLPFFGLKGTEYLDFEANTELEPGVNEYIFSTIVPMKKYGCAGIGIYRLTLGSFFNDNLFFISYGTEVKKKFFAGCSIRIFYREYGRDVYTEYYRIFNIRGYSKVDYTIDSGLIFKLAEKIKTGFVLHNLTQPNLSLSNINEDKFPIVVRTGLEINMDKHKFAIELDYDLWTETSRNTKFFASLGYNLFDRLNLNSSIGIGNNNYYDFTCGFTFSMSKFAEISYAFKYPLSGLKNVFSHKIGINFIFYPYAKKEIMEQPTRIEEQEDKEKQLPTKEEIEKERKSNISPSVIKKLRRILRKNGKK